MEIPEIVSGEKYNLKWNRHHNILATNVLEHLFEEELVDVTLSCEGKFIKAHKLILSASSQYFKELFQCHRDQNPIIIMTNIRFEYLQYIIDYIYKGEIKLLSSEIQGILNLANELQIKGLYGVLNKSFQHVSNIINDNDTSSKNTKLNNKTEGYDDEKPNVDTKTSATTTCNMIIDSEEKNRPKCSEISTEKKQDGSKMKQNRTRKRKIIENKTNPKVQCVDLSGAFREILPKPDHYSQGDLSGAFQEILHDPEHTTEMDTSGPFTEIIPKTDTIVVSAYDPSTDPYQVQTSPANGQNVPPLVPLLLKDISSQVAPHSKESLGIFSKQSKSNRNSNQRVTKSKVPSKISAESVANSTSSPDSVSETSLNQQLAKMKTEMESPKSEDGVGNKSVSVKQISAFMLFTDEYRPIVSAEYPDENVKQISLRLSCMWKNLSNQKKDSYYEEASRENEKLKQKKKK